MLVGVTLFFSDVCGQRLQVKLKSNEIVAADRLIVTENLFRQTPNLIIKGRNIKMNLVNEVYDSIFNVTYKPYRFRRYYHFARIRESGKIILYDFQSPDSRERFLNRGIASNNRFYYNYQGDTVLYVLNKKNYGKLFDSTFVSAYSEYRSIKQKYLRTHTTGILSAILIPNLITAAGFQSAAIIVPYIATTIYFTGSYLINRQKKFKNVQRMVAEYNKRGL